MRGRTAVRSLFIECVVCGLSFYLISAYVRAVPKLNATKPPRAECFVGGPNGIR